MSSDYASEINFIKRRIPTTKVDWKALPAVSQIASPSMSSAETQKIVAALKDALEKLMQNKMKLLAEQGVGRTANEIFGKMVSSVTSKLSGGSRVIIFVNVLRDVFGGEIDGDFGGGGKSYNPFSNKPKPPGRGV